MEKLEDRLVLNIRVLCEIEIMKLDIAALEQALTDAMKIQEESIQEKDQLKGIIKRISFSFERHKRWPSPFSI